jgi:hypothetical protein
MDETNISKDDVIKNGDTVIVLEDRKAKLMLTVTEGQTFQNKTGAYHHSTIIGKKYGSRVLLYIIPDLVKITWRMHPPIKTNTLLDHGDGAS